MCCLPHWILVHFNDGEPISLPEADRIRQKRMRMQVEVLDSSLSGCVDSFSEQPGS